MTTQERYAMPVEPSEAIIPSRFDSLMRWEYEDGRAPLLNLYEKGKERQWNSNRRIDWTQDLDPENPQELPDEQISIYGSDIWNRLTAKERANLRRHVQAQQLSQFMHGEQGALLCAAKIVQQVPSIDAKFYAATQVMDEARHVEVYARLPTIKDIGLWGPRIRKAYADMGVMSYADVDAEGLLAKDEQVAADFDARRQPA
jgi:hypothetical protein